MKYTKTSAVINTNARVPNNIAPSGFMFEPDVFGDAGLKVRLHVGHLNLP
tara:strand:+ start:362 stop:511 length:150 start_codon:yes stop_codon:yes gene_type:complete